MEIYLIKFNAKIFLLIVINSFNRFIRHLSDEYFKNL